MHPIDRKRYRVTHHTEEFACPSCGGPVYVGDVAVQPEDGGQSYCSWYCAGAGGRPTAFNDLAREVRAQPGGEDGNR